MLVKEFLMRALTVCAILSGIGTPAEAAPPTMNDGRFKRMRPGPPPNRDSVRVPNLNMHAPTYGGSGCAQGTVSSVISPDGKEISVLFDSFTVRAGGAGGPRTAVGSCRVNLPFQVPPGYSVQIVQVDYRGFNSLPQGAVARVATHFGFGHWRRGAGDPRAHLRRWEEFVGPLNDDFTLSSQTSAATFSPCGQPFVLTAESTIQVTTNAAHQDSFSQIDSLDERLTPLKLALRWVRCGSNGDPGTSGGGDPGGIVPQPPPPPPPPPPSDCPAATAQLNAANQAMMWATAALMQAGNTCGGNMFCVVQIQTAYNQAQTNLQAAQARVNRSCR